MRTLGLLRPPLCRRSWLAAVATSLASVTLTVSPLLADDVHLTNGSVFEDVVTKTTDTHVIIEMAIGKLTLPLAQVSKVISADTPIAEFRRRHTALLENPSSEAVDWLHLSRWGLANGLSSQASQAALFAARLNADLDGLAPMLAGLGYENLDNVGWIPRSEAMRLRGKVLYDGEWLTPNQRTARILSARSKQSAPQSAQHSQRPDQSTSDNAVALASIKLAEKALEHGEHASRRADQRTSRTSPEFGRGGYGVYAGVVIPQQQFASPEAAAAYNEQIQQDLKALTNRVPGSIIPLNNRGPTGSIFVARP